MWVASSCCAASPRIHREPPCSLSTRTSCYPSLKLRPPQTPGLDRTAALLRAIAHPPSCSPGHSDISIYPSRVIHQNSQSIARIVASAPIRSASSRRGAWQMLPCPDACIKKQDCHRGEPRKAAVAHGQAHLDSFYTIIQRDFTRQAPLAQPRSSLRRPAGGKPSDPW